MTNKNKRERRRRRKKRSNAVSASNHLVDRTVNAQMYSYVSNDDDYHTSNEKITDRTTRLCNFGGPMSTFATMLFFYDVFFVDILPVLVSSAMSGRIKTPKSCTECEQLHPFVVADRFAVCVSQLSRQSASLLALEAHRIRLK